MAINPDYRNGSQHNDHFKDPFAKSATKTPTCVRFLTDESRMV